LERAVELVQKLPFDDPVKEKFVTDLRASLFERHKSFLSNPLLLSIMLLTYSDVAHIPDKLGIFYNQAYESLFQKHDALKGGFQRERRSGLDIQDFGRAFAAFCIQSYDAREFSFSQSRALEICDRGKKITRLVYEPQAILDDALQAVCLLVEEGMEITFAHRSFQEYFAARFIYSCPSEVKSKLVKRITPGVQSDAVMALLHELDPYTVEQHYILPVIENLKSRIKLVREVGISHFLRYIKCLFAAFERRDDHGLSAMIADGTLFSATGFARKRYRCQPEEVSAERQAAAYQAPADAFDQEFGGRSSVSTKSLTTRNKFVRVLFDSPGIWGASELRHLLSIESLIRQSHKDAQSSLDAILATNRKS
jgi:hypothetical protein